MGLACERTWPVCVQTVLSTQEWAIYLFVHSLFKIKMKKIRKQAVLGFFFYGDMFEITETWPDWTPYISLVLMSVSVHATCGKCKGANQTKRPKLPVIRCFYFPLVHRIGNQKTGKARVIQFSNLVL